MKAIFLTDGNRTLQVYDEDVYAKLHELTGIERTVYKKDDIIKNPSNFHDVEYVFSTWGMSPFTEEEIGSCFPALKCVFYGAGTVQHFARPFLNCGIRVFSAFLCVPIVLPPSPERVWPRKNALVPRGVRP